MATVSSTRAASTFPVYAPIGAGSLSVAYGVYEIDSALSKNDIIEFCKLPACDVVGGFLAGDDLDTGTEAMEIDVGTADDPDQLLDSGVLTGDAVTDVLPTYAAAGVNYRPFNGVLKNGPQSFTEETTIQGVVTAAANAGGTGTVWARCDYLVD